MELKSMKLSEEEMMKNGAPMACCDKQEYPYGLRIHLCHESLEKLGIKSLPEMGKEVMVSAIAYVCSKNEYEHGEEVSKEMGLQITAMSIEAAPQKVKMEDKIYKEE